MKNSRTIVSQGFLVSGPQSLTTPKPGLPSLKFTPSAESCSQCQSCGAQGSRREVELTGWIRQTIRSSGLLTTAGIPVVVTVETGRIPAIVWNTLLLPLSGFVSGATLGYTLLQTEVAAICGAVAGLTIATWCTRQIPHQIVTVEPAGTENHGDKK